MKLTRTTKRNAGMTLLELTVVILVLLSLISVLFVGARAWKKGSDRAANILNIRNVQQAVRGHQNMNNLEVGASLPSTQIVGANGYLKDPVGPAGINYTYAGEVPEIGELYLIADGEGIVGGALGPKADDIKEW